MTATTTSGGSRLLRNCAPSSGFSLVELLAVVGITLIIAAIALPTMSKVIDNSKIRGALGEVSNITQMCRTQAVKTNVSQHLYFSTTAVPGRVVLYVKNASSVSTDPLLTTDPQLWLPPEFAVFAVPTGTNPPPELTGTTMWGSTLTPNSGVDPYFNSRGLPCLPDPTGACSTTSGFVYYFSYTSGGSPRWAAIGISPAGRIKGWFWNGSSWGN
jgi:prepilin-type N-terminal cleavage/methylation domain-containing protein